MEWIITGKAGKQHIISSRFKIALISFALVAVFFVPNTQVLAQENTENTGINAANTGHLNIEDLETYINSDTIAPGELGGTNDNPKVKCFGDKCSVDFGDFVINDLPKDYKEILGTSGLSG